jgi:CubicO group peptidase (beta-lactamase class C family)
VISLSLLPVGVLYAGAILASPLLAAPAGSGLPMATPTSVGMSAARLAAIDRVVNRGIDAGGYPGAAVVVGRKGAAVVKRGYGRLAWGSDAGYVSPDNTIYDIASLTKVVGTTSALMVLYDQGKISLDAPVSRYIPEFSGGNKDLVTIRLLLTHRSGLPAGRDLWRLTRDPDEAKRLVLATPLSYRPGQYYEYSDLGADVLGMVVERVSGERLDRFLQSRVFGPLGMTNTYFTPSASLRSLIAPTEIAPPRGYPIRGEVHDENAYALGGVAGHAGLFSTASDLAVFAQMMLNGGTYDGVRVLADSTVTIFTRRAAGHRALGWDTAKGDYGAGQYLTDRSYGHTGYTGTSMWIDPDRSMFVILLTNRVHAARALHPQRVISDIRSDLSDAAVLAVMDGPEGPLAMPNYFRADRAVGWNDRPARVRRSSTRARSASSKAARARAARAKSARAKTAAAKSKKSAAKSSKSTASSKNFPSKKKSVSAAKNTRKKSLSSVNGHTKAGSSGKSTVKRSRTSRG